MTTSVQKEKIAENGDYNLTGDRYRETVDYSNAKWPMVELREVAEYINGFAFKPTDWHDSGVPIIRIQNLTESAKSINKTEKKDIPDKYIVENGDLLISWSATIGFYIWNSGKAYLNQHIFKVIPKKNLSKIYFYYLGNKITEEIKKQVHGNTMTHITKGTFNSIKIPLPPLAVQEQIVAEIEQYQKVIDGAKQVVENWKPNINYELEILNYKLKDLSMVELGEVCQTITPPNKIQKGDYKISGKYPIIDQSQDETAGWSDEENSLIKSDKDLVIFGDHTCAIKYVDFPFIQGADGIKILKTNDELLPKFLYFALKTKPLESDGYQRHFTKLKLYKIPLPPLFVQEQIVAEIEAEQKVVNANKELIEKMQKKVEAKIGEVWGEEI